MGKMKIGIYYYFIADILTKVFRNVFECSSTEHQSNQKANFAENIKKNQLLRSYMGDKADTLQKCS